MKTARIFAVKGLEYQHEKSPSYWMLVTAVISVVVTCTYTVRHLLNFYWFLFLINVTCLDFQGNFFSLLLLFHLHLLLLLRLLFLLLVPAYYYSSLSMVLILFSGHGLHYLLPPIFSLRCCYFLVLCPWY